MPEDKTQVSEQEQENLFVQEEGLKEEAEAFGEPEEEEKKPEEGKEEEAKDLEEKKEESEEGTEDESEEEEAEKEEDEEEEEDEDLKRGEEILAAKEKAEAEEAERKRKEAAAQSDEEDEYVAEPIDEEEAKVYTGFLTKKDLAFVVAQDDEGGDYTVGDAIKENPGLPVIAGRINRMMIEHMVSQGVLMTQDQHAERVEGLKKEFGKALFDLVLLDPNNGIPKAYDIWGDKKFNEWKGGQPKAVQVLFEGSAHDAIRGFKRYLNDAGLKKAKDTVADLDEKRKKKKEKADSVLKSTVKSTKASAGKSKVVGDDTPEAEAEEFEKDD